MLAVVMLGSTYVKDAIWAYARIMGLRVKIAAREHARTALALVTRLGRRTTIGTLCIGVCLIALYAIVFQKWFAIGATG